MEVTKEIIIKYKDWIYPVIKRWNKPWCDPDVELNLDDYIDITNIDVIADEYFKVLDKTSELPTLFQNRLKNLIPDIIKEAKYTLLYSEVRCKIYKEIDKPLSPEEVERYSTEKNVYNHRELDIEYIIKNKDNLKSSLIEAIFFCRRNNIKIDHNTQMYINVTKKTDTYLSINQVKALLKCPRQTWNIVIIDINILATKIEGKTIAFESQNKRMIETAKIKNPEKIIEKAGYLYFKPNKTE